MDSKCNGTEDWVKLKTNMLDVEKNSNERDRGGTVKQKAAAVMDHASRENVRA